MREAVLVTDGEERSALAVARSLGRAGYQVAVCAARTPSLAGASRYVTIEHQVPHPLRDPDGHGEAVAAVLRERPPHVLLPVSEASHLSLLPRRDEFPDVVVPAPSLASFQAICDKAVVFEAARLLDIAVPPEQVAVSRDELKDLADRVDGFPLVAKPSRSVAGPQGRRRKLSVSHAPDRHALMRLVDTLPEAAFPVHIQRRIEGPGIGLFLLRWGGQFHASFAHRRIREKPPAGGVSVVRESIPAPPELESQARRLLEHFDWTGVAMVEFKLDASTGDAYLMEVNGRFWGSLQLAIDAGVDFPALLLDLVAGRSVAPESSYVPGVELRWFWGEVDHLLARLRRSREALALPSDHPGRLRATIDFLSTLLTAREEVFRWTDPGPAWVETRAWFGAAAPAGRTSRGAE